MAPRRADGLPPPNHTPAVPGRVHLTKAEVARQHIRNLVLTGTSRPGERLTTREVCEALGMSETPVREAMRGLAAEGLLDMHPHLGVVVAGVRAENLPELYLIAGLLSALGIELSAPSYNAAFFDRIERILAEAEAAVAADDFRTYSHLNRQFHTSLCDTPQALWTRKMLTGISEQCESVYRDVVVSVYRADISHAEHVAIFDAIKAGDIGRAAELMREHERRAGQVMLEAIRFAGRWPQGR